MKQRKWWYKHGTCYELFNVLFDNGRVMLVENADTKAVSFGPCDCFNTLCGFPVDWSCLTRSEATDLLLRFIEIDSGTDSITQSLRALEMEQFGYTVIDQWNAMISALQTV